MTTQLNTLQEYKEAYEHSVKDPEGFWAKEAETFQWEKKYDKVLDWNFEEPDVKWFLNGKLNITTNCLDRHIKDRGDQIAILWEANDPDAPSITYTYKELLTEVCKCANGLKAQGITKGDRVVFYMPMIPQLAIGLLACARIGAIHSVVFAGFSAQALADRVDDASAKMIVCADYNNRGTKQIAVKKVVDDAMDLGCNSVEKVVVFKHTNLELNWSDDVDISWTDLIHNQSESCTPELMDSEDMLFILYTSGSTGKPKGVVHTCGVIWCILVTLSEMYFNIKKEIFIGVQRILVGLLATPILYMVRC